MHVIFTDNFIKQFHQTSHFIELCLNPVCSWFNPWQFDTRIFVAITNLHLTTESILYRLHTLFFIALWNIILHWSDYVNSSTYAIKIMISLYFSGYFIQHIQKKIDNYNKIHQLSEKKGISVEWVRKQMKKDCFIFI